MNRTYSYVDVLDERVGGFKTLWGALLFGEAHRRPTRTSSSGANLVCSKLPNGRHAPVIDLDISHSLVPSSTPGHGHLYLDVEIPWWRYVVLLLALRLCGVIERGHCYWSIRRGATYVRVPWVHKERKRNFVEGKVLDCNAN